MADLNTFLTSDVMIYNALIKAQSTNKLLQQFKIKYPFEGGLAEESNTIFVADATSDLAKQTFNSEHYNALTELFIKTKKADYAQASTILRTVVKVIKDVLRKNEDLARYKPAFMKSASNYGSKFTLKGRNLLVQTKEQDLFDVEEEEIDKVCEIIATINEEGE